MNTPKEEPLVFRGRLTLEDVTHITNEMDLVAFRRPFRWAARLFGTGLAALCVLGIYLKGPHTLLITVIACWFLLLFTPLWRRLAIRHRYQRNSESYFETEVRLNVESVSTENAQHQARYDWKLIGIVCDTRNGVLFCNVSRQPLFWLPNRVFPDNETRQRVLNLVIDRGVQLRQFGRIASD